MTHDSNNILAAALEYAAKGIPVFPCKRTDKSPLTTHGHKDATTDRVQIREWWIKWPEAMIGIPTGTASGIDVLDLDVKKGKNGFAAIPDWQTRSAIIVRTPTDPSKHTEGAPSEGGHLWFRSEGSINGTTSSIAIGVDTKGEGGYVIGPPSMNGFGTYRFEMCGLDWISKLPTFPADLRPPDNKTRSVAAHPKKSANEKRKPLPDCLLDLIKSDPGGGLSNDPDDVTDFKAALAVIDPDIGRREWIAIGCVLYKAFGDEKGFTFWDEWSSEGGKYKAREMNKQWRSIVAKDGYDYDIGTLIYYANEADPSWQRPSWQRKIEPPVDEEAASSPPPDEDAPITEPALEETHRAEAPLPPDDGTEAKPEQKPAIEPDAGSLIISSRKFVANFVPPDYLIEGLLQRRFLYALTALTNSGKTTIALLLAVLVAEGLPLGRGDDEREIEKGKVLFFAGENPADVTMRWIKLCEERNIDPETDQVFWVPGVYSIRKLRKVIDAQTKKCGPFALIIIDSAAAYFEGDDENSNTQLGNYARMLRTLVEIYGGPTIIVLCHPVKNANPDSLLPRGGGAFLNEVDGNLVLLQKSELPKVVDLHWHGKFRGPDFSPISFKLTAGTSERIKDSKGRLIWTVTASAMTTAEKALAEIGGQEKQDQLLRAMEEQPGASLVELARYCGWQYKNGDPNKTLVNRIMHDLEAKRLVKKEGDRWKLTKAGLAAAIDAETM